MNVSKCTSVFCDPWLKYEIASEVFNVVYGQHNRGWDALYGWLNDNPVQSFRSVLDLALTHTGPIKTYGEYICPFMGNLMSFRDEELNSTNKSDLYTASTNYISSRHQNAELSADQTNKPKILQERSSSTLQQLKILQSNIKPISLKRYVLHDATSLCWGHGCVSDGVNCKSLTAPLLGANLLTTQEALRQNLQLDFVCIINTLDHVVNPLETLKNLLTISTHVLLINHAQPIISKQHHFVLRPGFLGLLKNQGMSVVDLSHDAEYSSTEINKDKIIALISR